MRLSSEGNIQYTHVMGHDPNHDDPYHDDKEA